MRTEIAVMLIAISLIFAGCSSNQQLFSGKQMEQILQKEITKNIFVNYLLYLPENYNSNSTSEKWPLIMFLHGSGERGTDIEKVKVHGPPKLIAEGKSFPFIVLSPQCPDYQSWDTDVLDFLLTDICKNYNVDKNRIYVTGLSRGGTGTWDLAARFPNRFAAIAPICGRVDVPTAELYKGLSIWVFHGAKDKVVPAGDSQKMVDAIKKTGGNVKFTLYPEAGHDSWTETYNNPELYEWFLKNKRIE
jgi:predicted peptidase